MNNAKETEAEKTGSCTEPTDLRKFRNNFTVI
jgi:hypothetical protein